MRSLLDKIDARIKRMRPWLYITVIGAAGVAGYLLAELRHLF